MPHPASRRRGALFATLLMAGTALGGFGAWHSGAARAQSPGAVAAPAAVQPLPGFADLVARVRPAVVTITTTEGATPQDPQSPFPPGSPRDRMFRRFFGSEGETRGPVHALGSGFLIDAEGHIVTNNHVLDGATSVKVTLDDGRDLPARIVGRDARSDLAVLKVQAEGPLPFLDLGDSDRARPGDWVVAVGNPYGLGGTVTVGVVSARGRNIGQGPYDDFIQIDAPINRGNSGGPLFGTDGSVIGVNTAIFSPTGGSIGIGFAIPSNVVRRVVGELEVSGHIDRGFLGAVTQELTPALARAMGLTAPRGALVADVTADGPAARAGLRAGDVVVALDGQPVADQRALARGVGDLRPGRAVTVAILREGHPQDLTVTLGKLPDAPPAAGAETAPGGRAQLGVALAPLDQGARERLHLPRGARGAVVADVQPGSPAAEAGVQPGDVITAIGSHEVTAPDQAARLIAEGLRAGRPLALKVMREGQNVFIGVAGPSQG